MAEPTDQLLVEQSLNGDGDAFGTLAQRHYRMVWMLAYQKTKNKADAEDLAQEALVRAFNALSSLRDPSRFASWLYNITGKLCIDWIRRRNRREATVSFDEEMVSRRESGRYKRDTVIGSELEAAEEQEQVLAEVGSLPDKYRLVITLRYLQKMSYKEIAAHLGEPTGTVANRLHRAMRMLQANVSKGTPSQPLEESR